MKENLKWIIAALSLVVVIGGASILFNALNGEEDGAGPLITDMPLTTAPQTTPSDTIDDEISNPVQPGGATTGGASEQDAPSAPDSTEGSTDKPEEPQEPTNPAPDFTMLDANGNSIKLSSLRGKPVVLNFWATWCTYCELEMPDFDRIYREYGGEIEFVMINLLISGDTVDKVNKYISNHGYTFPVYFDSTGEAADLYVGMGGIPRTYFIDAKGNLVAHAIGAIGDDVIKQGIDLIK